MRPNRASMRHRAVKFAFAVSWASSIQFAGCLNSPFQTDLAEEAQKTALRAEISERTAQDFASRSASSGFQLAGGDAPRDHYGITTVAGTKSTPKKHYPWMFWVKDDPESKDAKETPEKGSKGSSDKDAKSVTKTAPSKPGVTPAAKKPAPTSTPDAKVAAKPEVKAPAKPEVKVIAKPEDKLAKKPADDKGKAEQVKKPVSPENWFEKELAAKESLASDLPESKPAIAAAVAEALEPASAPETRPAVAASAAASEDKGAFRPFPASDEEKSFVAKAAVPVNQDTPAEKPESNWAMTPSTSVPEKSVPTAPVATSTNPFSLQPSQPDRAASFSESAVAAETERPAATSSEALVQRQQRLRVNAMLSEAHSCLIRGEVHAAYRSALIAERIAEENHLQFSAGEENPREFAREIAARLWKSDKADQPVLADSSESSSFELASAAGHLERPVQANVTTTKPSDPFDSSFGDSFAGWTAAPGTSSAVGSPSAQPSVAKTSVFDAAPMSTRSTPFSATASNESRMLHSSNDDLLPQIRPSTSVSSTTQPQASPFPSSTGSFGPSATAFSNRETEFGQGRVEFAIAQSVKTDTAPRTFQGPDRSFAEPGFSSHEQSIAAAAIETHRPLLQAPNVPDFPNSGRGDRSSDAGSLALNDSVAPEMTDPDAAPPRQAGSRILWIVFGFLGAGVATVLGLKYSRRDDDDTEDYDSPISQRELGGTSDPSSSTMNGEENSGLRIKRAA